MFSMDVQLTPSCVRVHHAVLGRQHVKPCVGMIHRLSITTLAVADYHYLSTLKTETANTHTSTCTHT